MDCELVVVAARPVLKLNFIRGESTMYLEPPSSFALQHIPSLASTFHTIIISRALMNTACKEMRLTTLFYNVSGLAL